MTSAVQALHVSVRRGHHNVVSDASFDIPQGAVTAVIGPNGSGKSTLLYLLAGLLDCDNVAGSSVSVFDKPPGSDRTRVALVLQSTEVSPRLPITVSEVVAMGRYALGGMWTRPSRTVRAADRAAVDVAMHRMEVSDLARRQVNELSGGQRQRVFMAQGLAQQADLLLLDEPVTGLDVVSRHRIMSVVAEEARRGAAVVMTTHDLNEAAEADHVLLLSGGTVVSGSPSQVLVPDVLRAAYGGRLLVVDQGAAVIIDDPHHHHGPH